MSAIIDYRGKTPTKQPRGIPLITAKVVKGGRIERPNEFLAEKDYEAWMRRGIPQEGDVLVTTEAPLGEIAQLGKGRVALAQRLIALRGKSGLLDNSFLRFLLQSEDVQIQLRSRATGTTVLGIKQSELRKVSLMLPPFPEQRRIASILRALDDKIELNRRMNCTLEEMAQAIFKSWFIDFDGHGDLVQSELGLIPRGWTASTVGHEFNLTMGQSPPGSTYNQGGVGLPFYQGATDFGSRYPTRRVFCSEPKRISEPGDTLISVRAPVGRVNMASEQSCVGRGVAALRHVSGSRSYTYWAARSLGVQLDVFNSEGTVFGSIGRKDFESIKVIQPRTDSLTRFEKAVDPMDSKIENNWRESRTLAALRDALLPKLISGEIRVPEVEEILEDVL